MARVLRMWEEEGRAMIESYLRMVGQWTSETGIVNRIYTLWEVHDLNQRRAPRERLLRHPGFAEYLARCRECYMEQEAVFLDPTPLSPLR